jgi:16S rRNA (adenine1518-N6/adenine1519-N6)-dimethyltransferase
MVKPKKYLGQHFLKDRNIAQKIVDCLSAENADVIMEIGPGTGVLTKILLQRDKELFFIEVDIESIEFLKKEFPEITSRILYKDFLKLDLRSITKKPIALIGNFPYNISTQIIFKVLENKEMIPEVVGMFQKEVAERIVSKPGNKVYGILSVLVQAFYETEYLFTVNETVFFPPPKVKSGVIRLNRKENFKLECDEKLFFQIVKSSFNQRRKVLRNSLKSFSVTDKISEEILSKRPEQLSYDQFILMAKQIEEGNIKTDTQSRIEK